MKILILLSIIVGSMGCPQLACQICVQIPNCEYLVLKTFHHHCVESNHSLSNVRLSIHSERNCERGLKLVEKHAAKHGLNMWELSQLVPHATTTVRPASTSTSLRPRERGVKSPVVLPPFWRVFGNPVNNKTRKPVIQLQKADASKNSTSAPAPAQLQPSLAMEVQRGPVMSTTSTTPKVLPILPRPSNKSLLNQRMEDIETSTSFQLPVKSQQSTTASATTESTVHDTTNPSVVPASFPTTASMESQFMPAATTTEFFHQYPSSTVVTSLPTMSEITSFVLSTTSTEPTTISTTIATTVATTEQLSTTNMEVTTSPLLFSTTATDDKPTTMSETTSFVLSTTSTEPTTISTTIATTVATTEQLSTTNMEVTTSPLLFSTTATDDKPTKVSNPFITQLPDSAVMADWSLHSKPVTTAVDTIEGTTEMPSPVSELVMDADTDASRAVHYSSTAPGFLESIHTTAQQYTEQSISTNPTELLSTVTVEMPMTTEKVNEMTVDAPTSLSSSSSTSVASVGNEEAATTAFGDVAIRTKDSSVTNSTSSSDEIRKNNKPFPVYISSLKSIFIRIKYTNTCMSNDSLLNFAVAACRLDEVFNRYDESLLEARDLAFLELSPARSFPHACRWLLSFKKKGCRGDETKPILNTAKYGVSYGRWSQLFKSLDIPSLLSPCSPTRRESKLHRLARMHCYVYKKFVQATRDNRLNTYEYSWGLMNSASYYLGKCNMLFLSKTKCRQ